MSGAGAHAQPFDTEPPVSALTLRNEPSEALRLAASFALAIERYLACHGGAAPRTTIVSVVRAWVPRWDADVPPILADALIEVLVRQGKVVATRNYVGTVAAVDQWRARFRRYPQRLTQPVHQVAGECDLPAAAVRALRVLAGPA